MASRALKLNAVPTPPAFADAMQRLAHLRTSILLIASPETAAIDLSMTFVDDQPAIAVALRLKALEEPERIVHMLRHQPLSDYRFDNVISRRDGMSKTKHIITAVVVAA